MKPIDLITILGNISQSLSSVQRFLTGFAYVLGVWFVVVALIKLKMIVASGRFGGASNRMFIPFAYFLGGCVFIFIPSAIETLGNTAFGISNPISYSTKNPYNIFNSVGFIIQTMGLVWFIRGCVLLVHASEPGIQWGPKGLVFLCAGVFAMNFQMTVDMLAGIMDFLGRVIN